MGIRLYNIDQAPRAVPTWPQLLADLCHPTAARVARVLGVSVRTVKRYNQAGQAPRAVCLALYWLTRWGRSAVHAQAVNDAVLASQLADALQRRVTDLEGLVSHLQEIGHFGAANAPTLADREDRHALPR